MRDCIIVESLSYGPRVLVYQGKQFFTKRQAAKIHRELAKGSPGVFSVVNLRAADKHRRATKHIQQLVTHPVTSEITGKLHMRLRSAETALRWAYSMNADAARASAALNSRLHWAYAALAGSWAVLISVLIGVGL